MKTTITYKMLMMTCLIAVFGLAGCQKEDTAEKAGKKIDRAAESAEQKIDQAKEQAEKQIEAAKESVIDKSQATGEYADDTAITTRVKMAIANDPLLNTSRIEVTTNKGVVTLNGTVSSESNIARAAELVKTQKGVMSVQNNLVVSVAPDKM